MKKVIVYFLFILVLFLLQSSFFCYLKLADVVPNLLIILTVSVALMGGRTEGCLVGFFCGLLIYLAVDIYAKHKTPVGIIFCIPVFILSGYEHSIADMFYFATSGIVSLKACGFIWTVILGNSIGGMLIPALALIGQKPDQQS